MMKHFKISLFIIVLISSNLFAQSQDSLLKVYNSQTIYQYGNKFVKGSAILTYRDMEREFNNPLTKQLYKKSKSRIFLSRLFTAASLGVTTASIFTKTNTIGTIEFSIGTGILALVGIYYHTLSSKYLERAIWERNKEILFKTLH